MPKDTFFRLPDDKRDRILKGAKKEFYNCTFSEASINRIIKDAEIPRGSFYQYFEDKKDLYLYVIEENIKSVISNFGNKLEQSGGDIFLCVDNFISELLDETTKKAKEIGYGILQFNAVVATNQYALKLYKKLGFVQLGVIPNGFRMKDGTYEDIIPHYHTL